MGNHFCRTVGNETEIKHVERKVLDMGDKSPKAIKRKASHMHGKSKKEKKKLQRLESTSQVMQVQAAGKRK